MLASPPPSDLADSLSDLALLLYDEEWETADRLTAQLLLTAVEQSLHASEAPRRAQLIPETLAGIPCQLLHALDDCWQGASAGHFGFSTQLQIYQDISASVAFDPSLGNWSTPHPFFEDVGWLMLFPLRPLGFLRFYNWLEFDLEAPRGHLPALWYWQIPQLASLRTGGFFTGQGGGFGDLARLDAMLLRLSRCGQLGG